MRLAPPENATIISPPFGRIGKPVAESIYAINLDVDCTPVSWKMTNASQFAPVTDENVASSASNTPFVVVLFANVALDITAELEMSLRN